MDTRNNIVITGAAGFIGSCLVGYLNEFGFTNLLLVDDFSRLDKLPNLEGKVFREKIERESFFQWLSANSPKIDFVFHLGARTDTTEFDYNIHQHLNVEYSKKVWNYCTVNDVPLVYASSAATYGGGEWGYDDDQKIIEKLRPLNPYGESKNEFDKWVLRQETFPAFWAGLKFFNVYGPNEYHKARMASVIWHSFNEIRNTGAVKLFKSYRQEYEDGKQRRDFVYVKDVLKVCHWLMEKKSPSGIYNLGTGRARTFQDLVKATFSALNIPCQILFIEMPVDIRDKYQYFTEARMDKLRNIGYREEFFSLEQGIQDYVINYLTGGKYF